jgi:hypothetical protein
MRRAADAAIEFWAERKRSMRSGARRQGRVSGEVTTRTLLAILVIVGVMIVIAIPGVARQRRDNQAAACVINLTRIENAKIRRAIDRDLPDGTTVTLRELVEACPAQLPYFPRCPSEGAYTVGPIGGQVRCSLADEGHSIEARVVRTRQPVAR